MVLQIQLLLMLPPLLLHFKTSIIIRTVKRIQICRIFTKKVIVIFIEFSITCIVAQNVVCRVSLFHGVRFFRTVAHALSSTPSSRLRSRACPHRRMGGNYGIWGQ